MKTKKKISSVFKKYLMAISGSVLVIFVLIHMLGNLQMFEGPDAINHYAHLLQTLPMPILWGFRLFLLGAVMLHVWMAILLTRENRQARPQSYHTNKTVQATVASKTMGISGSIILIFIVFHILHYTLRVIYPEYQSAAFYTSLNNETVYNVYQMMIVGFSKVWVAVFYVGAMGFLCLHLTHAVWSMFQTLGWATSTALRNKLKILSVTYGWVIFIGFVSIPISVQFGFLKPMVVDMNIDKVEVELVQALTTTSLSESL